MTAMRGTDRDRRRPDRARRAPVGDGAGAGRAARAAVSSSGCGRDPGLRGLVDRATPATSRSTPGSRPTRTRGRRTGPRSASSCRASRTWSPTALADPTRRAAADRRWRLHGPRRGDGRPAAGRSGPTGCAIAWFDAHGDFNTPDTTPSGNVWGMPFAMLCGRGDPDLVAAADGPTVAEADAALLGGQVLDETESRMLAASRVAHLRRGDARRRRRAWPRSMAGHGRWPTRSTGVYIAFDMDCLDASGGWAVTMPESDGLSLDTAVAAVADARGGDAGRRASARRPINARQRRRRRDDRRGGAPRRGRARR